MEILRNLACSFPCWSRKSPLQPSSKLWWGISPAAEEQESTTQVWSHQEMQIRTSLHPHAGCKLGQARPRIQCEHSPSTSAGTQEFVWWDYSDNWQQKNSKPMDSPCIKLCQSVHSMSKDFFLFYLDPLQKSNPFCPSSLKFAPILVPLPSFFSFPLHSLLQQSSSRCHLWAPLPCSSAQIKFPIHHPVTSGFWLYFIPPFCLSPASSSS